jgi:uncharacterized membrane protein
MTPKGVLTMQTKKLPIVLGSLVFLYVLLGAFGPIPLSPALSPSFAELARFFALVLFVVVGVVWLGLTMSKARSRGKDTAGNPSAERILRERYARGEVDRSQFAQMLNDLRGNLSLNP